MCIKTIIMYSIPAYGHVYSTLALMEGLTTAGYTVIYYSLDPFRESVEAKGCCFRSYALDAAAIDLTDGKRLPRLYRLLLEHTAGMLPQLLKEAGEQAPAGIIFDSLALWGRAVGELLAVPHFSFYSIAAIDRVFSESFFRYSVGFPAECFRHIGELPEALRLRRYLKKRYGIRHLGMLRVLMNRGDYNLMGFSRRMQPGGKRLGKKYLFLGSLSPHRNRFAEPETGPRTSVPLIYISLGTIFNENEKFFQMVAEQLGNQDVQVIIAARLSAELQHKLPANFIAEPFVDQPAVLKQADLFISAGGMNSIHEALFYGVPCLLCPQQGEQHLNAGQLRRQGFCLILKDPRQLGVMAKQAMGLKDTWPQKVRAEMTKTRLKRAVQVIQYETGKVNNGHEKSISDRGDRVPG